MLPTLPLRGEALTSIKERRRYEMRRLFLNIHSALNYSAAATGNRPALSS
jgi:hypothetical protein